MAAAASRRTACPAVAASCLLLASSLCVFSQEAPVPPALPAPIFGGIAEPTNGTTGDSPPNLFATDRIAARRLKLAETRISDGVYDEAVELLQAILDAEEDTTAPAADGTETFQSLKGKALDLLSKLPAEGSRIYELKYGVTARGDLAEAVKTGDWGAVEAVSRQFFHTAAGQEATYRLAIRAQDRGEPLHAALLYERLSKANSDAFEPRLSFRATAAWVQAGMPDAARATAERYIKLATGKRLGGEGVPQPPTDDLNRLLVWLEENAGHSGSKDLLWPVFGGEVDRFANVQPVTIANGLEWVEDINTPSEWDSPREQARAELLSEGFEFLLAAAQKRGEPLMQPAFHPIIAGNVVVLRTLQHIRAVDVATGRLLWHTERPHDQVFDREIGDLRLLTEGDDDFGRLQLGEHIAELAWRNATIGMISTDGRYVYGIEGTGRARTGMAIPVIRGGRPVALGEDAFNTLYAYDLAAEGRIAWTAGGPPSGNTISGQFFLGAPLPLGGRLYSLVEEDGIIRLQAMDPNTSEADRVLWSQTLLAAERPLKEESLRRISGLSPAFSDGVLVCPTGAGAVVAVDLGQRVLLWGYQYQRNTEARQAKGLFGVPQFPTSTNDVIDRWLDAVPRIIDGLVFLTPRDSDELHCLNLADGRRRWTQPRGGMLYIGAVRNGKVIMIGRRSIAALDTATGETVWERPLGEGQPSGHGVASGEVYHLPLTTGEVATIHLTTGQILVRSPIGEDIVPGNLVAAGGRLLFQSATKLGSFHRNDGQEAKRQESAPETTTPEALALRGENRLHRGETESGLADLHRAVSEADLPRAKRLFVAAMLDGLRTDFQRFRGYEPDVLEIADDPQQRSQFLRLFADGLYEAGEPRAAVAAYLRLADGLLSPFQPEPADELRLVRADRLIQVRIGGLYAAASSAERSELDGVVTRHLNRLAAAGDKAGLERLATLFRDTPYGRQALARLAERYRNDEDPVRLDRVLARLGETGETGEPVTLNSSVVPKVNAAASFDGSYRGEFLPDELKTGREAPQVEARFDIPVLGAPPEEFEQWRFSVDSSRRTLIVRDGEGREQWRLDVSDGEQDALVTPAGVSRDQVRFSGRLLAIVVGARLVVIDPLSQPGQPTVLWSRELMDRRFGQYEINRRIIGDPTSPCGPIGFAGAELLLYQVGSTVTAADPLTGETVWQRYRLPYGCELTGDREFVVLQPMRSSECFVLRAADGADVRIGQSGDSQARLGWQGTRVLSWERTEDDCKVTCRDVARQRDVWVHRFPATARQQRLATGEIAILDAPSGQFELLRSADGEPLLKATIHPDPLIDRFLVLRGPDRCLLFTRRTNQGISRIRVEADRNRFPIDGLAYAFDVDGRRLWSSAIKRQYLSTDQPVGLPFLFLTARHHPVGEKATHRGAVLDVRTGELLVDLERAREFMPFETTTDPSTGAVTIQVPEGRFSLKPIDQPLPESRSDGPGALQASG